MKQSPAKPHQNKITIKINVISIAHDCMPVTNASPDTSFVKADRQSRDMLQHSTQ